MYKIVSNILLSILTPYSAETVGDHQFGFSKQQINSDNTEWPKKLYTLLQHFGGFESVWMPMVATSNTHIESKIQGHLSYQFCFCINTVVTNIE